MSVYMFVLCSNFFFFSSRRRHTRLQGDWSSDVCSSDLVPPTCLRGRICFTSIPTIATSVACWRRSVRSTRSEEHTSELQSPCNLVCRLLLEKKKINWRLSGRILYIGSQVLVVLLAIMLG